MRVLFVAPFLEPAWAMGGMAISPAAWAQALQAQGHQVEVLTTNADVNGNLSVPLGKPIERDGYVVTYFPRFVWSGNRFVSPQLFEACRKKIQSFDCLHAVGLWTFPSLVASLIAESKQVPYVLSLHGGLMAWAYGRHRRRKQLFMQLVEGRRLSHASALLCSSEMEQNHFKQLGLPGKSYVISNIVRRVDTELVQARRMFRTQYHLEDAQVLLFAGRLVENKGLHLTLAAFAAVANQFPQARLVIVGPSEDKSSAVLKRQVHDSGLADRVLFVGTLSGNAYWQAIAGADMFVLNSYSENFGMAPAEALSLGKPVLLSDQVGIASLVQEYHAGMIAPLDLMAITQVMQEMLSDGAMLDQMGQNGMRLAREHFSSSVVGKRLADLFNSVIHARKTNA
ncbi:MAG: glycosyltransferase [Chloroflexi bacterium]|nr:glycosyltransferase [Chloroflexota bacterium]